MSCKRRRALAAVMVLAATGCGSEPTRPGAEPSAPLTASDVAGNYEAVSMLLSREDMYRELMGEPGTYLYLRLISNGSVRGQLNISSDPELRIKRPLLGSWELHAPAYVTFELRPDNFLNETVFQVRPPGLVGEWLGPNVTLRVELAKISVG